MPTTPHPAGPQLSRRPACGAPAAIERRTVLESTDGPVEHAKVRCVRKHTFLLPTAMLDHGPVPVPDGAPHLTPR